MFARLDFGELEVYVFMAGMDIVNVYLVWCLSSWFAEAWVQPWERLGGFLRRGVLRINRLMDCFEWTGFDIR